MNPVLESNVILQSSSYNPRGRDLDVCEVNRVDANWDGLLNRHASADVFYHSAWANVLMKTYAHKPTYLQCLHEGRTVGLVPIMHLQSVFQGRRGVGLPFTDLCAPLYEGVDVQSAFIKKLQELGRERGWRHFEIRGGEPPEPAATPSLTFYGHTLDLRVGAERIFKGFHASVRRAVQKAQRSGLKVEVTRAPEAMREYYALHVDTRRRHGLPPQPYSFFSHIQSEVIDAGLGFLTIVSNAGQAKAGAVFFHHGQRAIYKFGASDLEYQSLRVNNLAMWAGIQRLVELGAQSLFFGRTSRGNDGLRRFKLAWGTQEETLAYYRYDLAGQRWVTARDRVSGFYNAVFERLPHAVNCFAGTLLYPHLD